MNPLSEKINQIKVFIANGQTEKALAELLFLSKEQDILHDKALKISARFKKLRNQNLAGTIASEHYTLESNKINDALFHLLRDFSKKTRSPLRKWISRSLLSTTILGLVILGIFWIGAPREKIILREVEIPATLENMGFNKDFVTTAILLELEKLLQSGEGKLDDLFLTHIESSPSKTKLKNEIQVSNEQLFAQMDFSRQYRQEGILIYEPIQALRRLLGKQDNFLNIQITEDNEALILLVKLTSGKHGGEVIIDEMKNITGLNGKEKMNPIARKVALIIAQNFAPISTVLTDYAPSLAYEYETSNHLWKEELFTFSEKENLLQEVLRKSNGDQAQKKWASVVLGSLYEERGRLEDMNAYKSAMKVYEEATSNSDTIFTVFFRTRYQNLSEYISLSQGKEEIDEGKQLLDEMLINNPGLDNKTQLILAFNKKQEDRVGFLYGYERSDEGNWQNLILKTDVSFGRKGIALFGDKVEGDKKTPTGLFDLGVAFGYEKDIETLMPFKTLQPNDYWITDPLSTYYNQWLDYLPANVQKYEKMRRTDRLHKYGMVIRYNMEEPEPNKGSAITIHVEKYKGFPTAGCIAVPEDSLKHIIEWLDPAKQPTIIIGMYEELRSGIFLHEIREEEIVLDTIPNSHFPENDFE